MRQFLVLASIYVAVYSCGLLALTHTEVQTVYHKLVLLSNLNMVT